MIAQEISTYLKSKGILTTGNVFIDYEPSSPDDIVVINNTGGFQSDAKLPYDRLTVQVVSRSISPLTAYNKLAAIYSELHGLSQITLSDGTLILDSIGLQPQPNNIGRDDKNRQRYTLNFAIEVVNQTTHRNS